MARPAEPLDVHFTRAVTAMSYDAPGDPRRPVRPGTSLTGKLALDLFDAQAASRHLDLIARELREQGTGFYTIGSAGHEANAAVAAATRPTDPALLHYRSGGFYLHRARQAGHSEGVLDVLLGMVAAADEPIAGGRHKVFGHPELSIIPQTSTIASHLPRAVGLALAIDRAARLRLPGKWPADAVVICSFGDASLNHSTAAGAINVACHCAHQHLPLPLLLVCEDNGLGISVATPPGWIAAAYGSRPHLRYLQADGSDIAEVYDAALDATEWVRTRRAPVLLHIRCVRFMGHAGSDVESAYRAANDIRADYRRDPLVGTARLLVTSGTLSSREVVERYEARRAEVAAAARDAVCHPVLMSAQEVMAPLRMHRPNAVAARVAKTTIDAVRRARFFEGALPEDEGRLTLAQSVNRALGDVLLDHPESLLFGEDVAMKGGVYGVTRGLLRKLGAARVFDTLLDEQAILGLALGAGLAGLLPIAEIQYLAYLHNAEDQLRGEAATLSFFSRGQFVNPMIVRIASYAYQKGFGGHFHNDDSVAVLRDIPGLVVASPARPDDAAAMLRTCAAAAEIDGNVCVFLEPIALYHTADLHRPGDRQWSAEYSPPTEWGAHHVPIGQGRVYGDGDALALITSGNGVYMSLRVMARLAEAGIACRVLDMRWLSPLPIADIVREAEACGRVLVVDETRRSGGISEGVLAALVDAGFRGAMARVTSQDSFVPLGPAAGTVLLSEAAIEKAARYLVEWR